MNNFTTPLPLLVERGAIDMKSGLGIPPSQPILTE